MGVIGNAPTLRRTPLVLVGAVLVLVGAVLVLVGAVLGVIGTVGGPVTQPVWPMGFRCSGELYFPGRSSSGHDGRR
ncbi:hypothetical protein MA47_10785 [Corynebacterium auriscanis]|uniref:Uncharacterized protein n=1 Tax=Corynebacterium auriscanis TaxID=99807 RepID=A0A0A2DJR8_9CORY|nr:hypothetical protein MA47_10785 [Corynebacterium auriscanis]